MCFLRLMFKGKRLYLMGGGFVACYNFSLNSSQNLIIAKKKKKVIGLIFEISRRLNKNLIYYVNIFMYIYIYVYEWP